MFAGKPENEMVGDLTGGSAVRAALHLLIVHCLMKLVVVIIERGW
jgi:hypothetical protein